MMAVSDSGKKGALEDLYRSHWESFIFGYENKMKCMPASLKESSLRALEAGT
jgi:hypothetical protein